jgi:hypothetical protein
MGDKKNVYGRVNIREFLTAMCEGTDWIKPVKDTAQWRCFNNDVPSKHHTKRMKPTMRRAVAATSPTAPSDRLSKHRAPGVRHVHGPVRDQK